jgi:hypothetical protein
MKEKTTMDVVFDGYLRSLIQGKSPYEKLEIIRRETGLRAGRETLKLRQLDPGGYGALCKAKQPEPVPARNPRMGNYQFIGR